MSLWLDMAMDDLEPYVASWVNYGASSDKRELLNAYTSLKDRKKKAIDTYLRTIIPEKLVLYRQMKSGRDFSGASMTEDPSWLTGSATYAFEVDRSDVMLHFKMENSWIGSKRYSHEKEVILKPGANPRKLGKFDTETGKIVAESTREHLVYLESV
jgi:hypothetical protein